jgi:dTMP kinase
MLDFAPPPDLIFLIDLPESIAFQRKDDTPSLYYLKERREIYRWLSREYKMEVIDGTKSMAEVEAEVKRRLLL